MEDPRPADARPGSPRRSPSRPRSRSTARPEALRGGLEALLFVVDAPVDEGTLAAALRCPVGRSAPGWRRSPTGYDARRAGIVLRRVGEGWRLYTRDEHARVIER